MTDRTSLMRRKMTWMTCAAEDGVAQIAGMPGRTGAGVFLIPATARRAARWGLSPDAPRHPNKVTETV